VDIPVHTGGGGFQQGPQYDGGGWNGGGQYYDPNQIVQIGDPRQRVYGNGPQSYATWEQQPAIRYQGLDR